MHKRTPRYNSSEPEKRGGSPSILDVGPLRRLLAHQKTRMPLFLPRITPIPIYFHPVYFHSPRSHTRLCLYPISASSLRITFSSRSETRARAPSSLTLFLFSLLSLSLSLSFCFSFSSHPVPNGTRTNRTSLTISKSLRFMVTPISLLFYLSSVLSFALFPPFLLPLCLIFSHTCNSISLSFASL